LIHNEASMRSEIGGSVRRALEKQGNPQKKLREGIASFWTCKIGSTNPELMAKLYKAVDELDKSIEADEENDVASKGRELDALFKATLNDSCK